MLTEYQQQLRDRLLAAPVSPPPPPWRPPASEYDYVPIGGLLGVGFGIDPETGNDLVMVVSSSGFGVIDPLTNTKIARDRNPDPAVATPDNVDLTCPGLGPLAGTSVRIAGLLGGGLHTTTADGWCMDVIAPEWPNHRVLLSANAGRYDNPAGDDWWHVVHVHHSEFRAAGFSPSGRSLVVATSSDVTLMVRDHATSW
jgi:hypothetical protein